MHYVCKKSHTGRVCWPKGDMILQGVKVTSLQRDAKFICLASNGVWVLQQALPMRSQRVQIHFLLLFSESFQFHAMLSEMPAKTALLKRVKSEPPCTVTDKEARSQATHLCGSDSCVISPALPPPCGLQPDLCRALLFRAHRYASAET
jgi:hypothetical protein